MHIRLFSNSLVQTAKCVQDIEQLTETADIDPFRSILLASRRRGAFDLVTSVDVCENVKV